MISGTPAELTLSKITFTEQNETQDVQSSTNESKVREVFIVKRSTKMDSDEYVSVQLKSSDDSIEKLLKKAVSCICFEYSKRVPQLRLRGFNNAFFILK